MLHIVCLQLDLWYVILNGAVEITYGDGRSEILCMGNSFGITPSLDKQFMNGVVRTRGDDCQVMPIALTHSLSYTVERGLKPRSLHSTVSFITHLSAFPTQCWLILANHVTD